ncbi:uncharacterized protein [Watersipora subatra]|uniref:uncharacterized protein n=1 Tax=Watersipora subatra TaxID=2589382 RepID=UPI00355C6470
MEDTAIPVDVNDFVQKNKLDEVLSKQQDAGDHNHYNVAVISGVSGAGKSEVALQVKKRMESEHPNIISGRLDCATKIDLKNSLGRLTKREGLELPDRDDLDLYLKVICKALIEKYPHENKLLIFDDVEINHILYSIDQNVCKQLQNQRLQWTIIITTQKQDSALYSGCDLINKSKHEVMLTGLSDDEFEQFFKNKKHTKDLSEAAKAEIKQKIGRLPVFLQVLRANLETDQFPTIEKGVAFYLHEDNYKQQKQNPALAMLRKSFDRIIDSCTSQEQKDQFIHLIKLLTMIGERRVTRELLIALAEVVLESDTSYQSSYREAHSLQSELVSAMRNRSLCDDMIKFDKTKLFNTHNNIKLAMKTFRREIPEHEAKLILETLTALTRVMPKDGRARLSSNILPCLYEHGDLLIKEVEKFHKKGDLNPHDLIVTIRLLTASLHAAMAYCQQTLKTSEENGEHFKKAVEEIISIVSLETTSENFMREEMVRSICDRLTSDDSPLLNSESYKNFVDRVVAHSIVTTKDLGFMFPDYRHRDDSTEDWFANGFFDVSFGYLKPDRLNELRTANKLVDEETMRKIYPLELLAEIYIIASKKTKSSESLPRRGGEASLIVCEKVTQIDGNIRLMMETITKRELLKVEMQKTTLGIQELKRLESQWKALKEEVDHDAYEYGKVRTNFFADDYHKNVCEEQMLCCEGRRFALETVQNWDPERFETIKQRFTQLIDQWSSTAKKNHMTISILEMNYADFLFWCGDRTEEQLAGMEDVDKARRSHLLRTAIQVLLSAFIDLREELRERTEDHGSPEVKSNKRFGKYVAKLRKFFASYTLNPSDGGLLPNSQGENYERIKYVKETCAFILDVGDKYSDLSVMQEVFVAAGFNQYDDAARNAVVSNPEETAANLENDQ